MEDILLRGIKQKKKRILKEEVEYNVDGERLPLLNTFDSLKTKAPFSSPLLAQKVVVPYFMKKYNIIVQAFTGSGKTLSYCLPLVETARNENLFGMILVPGRALVRQVYRVVREIKHRELEIKGIYRDGSEDFFVEEDEEGGLVERRIDSRTQKEIAGFPREGGRIVIGTLPSILSLMDLFEMKAITHLIIDEADLLINPETIDVFASILQEIDVEKTHVGCFSATMNEYVEQVIETVKNITKIHIVSRKHIDHEFVFGTNRKIKHLSLLQIVADGIESPTLIFVRNEETGEFLSKLLDRSGVYKEGSGESAEVLDDFRLKKIWYLFATDALSRGIDFYNIRSVINYDLPDTKTQLVHRVGRVNRNCQGQKVYTIYSGEDFGRISLVAEFLEENGHEIPSHITRIIEKSRKRIGRRS
ncbi:DEAD box ATP-dependent RNA helicase [Encephalitozoon intestinalis ATCC 50506]|uniref:ATP-dependent RNA helicase n=1 Tax=Encephalitozoon intestinalis (strain ATCC 50506) TaxID=876142 RepID=E0S830_ENCIT|nr:DEAD box ATP-dependent RNA helicase [Encephalitozoon intestinalis ATCC 50506]ADM11865.1 DEAD box ATP-dependent RNA helicase [Encephalitozoon intestinalis ATCC 50506]UTX45620.1 RNA helicase [Encephalitozoon intestinalis]